MPSKEVRIEDVAQNILACIAHAQKAIQGLASEQRPQTSARIRWLEGQLAHLIGQLRLLMDDMENRLALGQPCLWSDEEAEEMVDDSIAVIATLISLIRTLQAQQR